MATTKFISKMEDERIAEAVWACVGGEEDTLVKASVERGGRGCPFMVDVEYDGLCDCGDGEEPIRLNDTYTVDDYDIEPFDWSGNVTSVLVAWRRRMLDLFGDDYATYYVLGRYEEMLDDNAEWLIES